MEKETSTLTLEDFARLFGTSIEDISGECRELISKSNFSYQTLTGAKRDATILAILKKIDSEDLPVAGEHEQSYWERTWGDIRETFVAADHDLTGLIPKYMRHALCARLYKDYVMPDNEKFWVQWFDVFRQWLFEKYLKDIDTIHEFGCGTGHNLAVLARLFPEKKLHGYDWVQSSADTVTLLAEKHGYKVEGHLCNMFSPDEQLSVSHDSAVVTIHALEQLGPDFENFLDFVIRKSPALCINIEPLYELYDPENLVDYLAMKFHKKRNYLQGYVSRLRELESSGRIEILKVQRVPFGSLYHDSYSYIVWRPVV